MMPWATVFQQHTLSSPPLFNGSLQKPTLLPVNSKSTFYKKAFIFHRKNAIAEATLALTFHVIWSENRLNFPNPEEELQPAFPPGCTDSTASEADRQGSADRQNPSVPDRLRFPLWG